MDSPPFGQLRRDPSMRSIDSELDADDAATPVFDNVNELLLEHEKDTAEGGHSDAHEEIHSAVRQEASGTEKPHLSTGIASHLLVFLYFLVLQSTSFRICLGSMASIALYAVPLVYTYIHFPVILAVVLTKVLKACVIFVDQLTIGAIHLSPWVRDGSLHLYVHAEDVRFGTPKGFSMEFLHVKDFKISFEIKMLELMKMATITNVWNPAGSIEFNTKDCPTKMHALHFLHRKSHSHKPASASAAKFPRLRFGRKSESSGESPSNEGGVPRSRRSGRIGNFLRSPRQASSGSSNGSGLLSVDDLGSPGREDSGLNDSILKEEEDEDDEKSHERPVPHEKPRFGIFEVHYVDIEGAMINFEMGKKSDFIVNAFMRDLALGKANQALSPKPLPNMLKVRILQARKLRPHGALQKFTDAKVRVTLRKQSDETHVAMQTNEPVWNTEFVFDCEDPSAVVHVEIFDTHMSGAGLRRCIGQWVMTTYWLAVDPKHCLYCDGELNVSKDSCAIVGWFPLLDYKHRRSLKEDQQNGDIRMELKWYYDAQRAKEKATETSKPIPALEQLQENSAETQLRLGSIERVLVMLETFPYKLNVQRCTLRNIHFYLGDLFAGSQSLSESLGRARGIRIKHIEIDHRVFKTKSKHIPGVSLKEFLISFFIRGIAPKVLQSGSTVGSGLREIFYSLIAGKKNTVQGLESFKNEIMHIGDKVQDMLEQNHYSRMLMMVMGAENYHQKTVGADDTDIFKEVRLEGYLRKAASKPGALIQRYRTVDVTLQGHTIFYWHTATRDHTKRVGEGRKLYVKDLEIVEVFTTDKGEQYLILQKKDGSTKYFSALNGSDAEGQPTFKDWITAIEKAKECLDTSGADDQDLSGETEKWESNDSWATR